VTLSPLTGGSGGESKQLVDSRARAAATARRLRLRRAKTAASGGRLLHLFLSRAAAHHPATACRLLYARCASGWRRCVCLRHLTFFGLDRWRAIFWLLFFFLLPAGGKGENNCSGGIYQQKAVVPGCCGLWRRLAILRLLLLLLPVMAFFPLAARRKPTLRLGVPYSSGGRVLTTALAAHRVPRWRAAGGRPPAAPRCFRREDGLICRGA